MKLHATKRTLLGKKVKNLRAENITPGAVFGPKRPSTAIEFDTKSFSEIFKKKSYNKLFDLEVEGDKTTKVLIKEVQIHPVRDEVLNVSLYQVDEDSKLIVEVPVEYIGESPAVKNNLGFFVSNADSIELHCLPKDIPASLVVDISNLTDTGHSILIEEIKFDDGVELASHVDPKSAVAYIAARQKEIIEEVVETPAEGEEGAAEGESTEGAEGEEKKEEEK